MINPTLFEVVVNETVLRQSIYRVQAHSLNEAVRLATIGQTVDGGEQPGPIIEVKDRYVQRHTDGTPRVCKVE